MFLCILNYKFKRIQSVLLRHFVSPTHWFGALIGLVSRQNKPKTILAPARQHQPSTPQAAPFQASLIHRLGDLDGTQGHHGT